MKKVLVLYYSQSGQLENVINQLVAPLNQAGTIDCDCRAIRPAEAFPYPWSFFEFFGSFPEAVNLDGCAVAELDLKSDYDLIILGYTVWFLSPAIPVTGFLKSDQARFLFKDKPVVTVIACRDMWLSAQEQMKVMIKSLGGRLLDNVVLCDQGKSLYTFVTTPRWLFTGKKDKFWFFPPAGIAPDEIKAAERFGQRLVSALRGDRERGLKPLLSGLGAANVNGKLVAAERIARRSFTVWSRILKKAGGPGSNGRNTMIIFYSAFLLIMILTLVPFNLLLRKIFAPWRRKAVARAVAYYEQPSGR